MRNKQLLLDLCKELEQNLNLLKGKNIHKVELISCMKPSDYYLPVMYIGTGLPITRKLQMALFVEIYVDDKCVFRESYIPNETEDINVVESFLIDRVLKQVFMHGIMSAKRNIEEREKLK